MSSVDPPEKNPQGPPWKEAHARALKEEADGYRDPVTGFWVWTEIAHQKRGDCCHSGCRHCPYRETQESQS